MANNKPKTEKVDIETTKEDIDEIAKGESAVANHDVFGFRPAINCIETEKPYIKNAAEAISSLIVSLCEEAKSRRMRDEYKSYESIAALMTSLK